MSSTPVYSFDGRHSTVAATPSRVSSPVRRRALMPPVLKVPAGRPGVTLVALASQGSYRPTWFSWIGVSECE